MAVWTSGIACDKETLEALSAKAIKRMMMTVVMQALQMMSMMMVMMIIAIKILKQNHNPSDTTEMLRLVINYTNVDDKIIK